MSSRHATLLQASECKPQPTTADLKATSSRRPSMSAEELRTMIETNLGRKLISVPSEITR